MKYQVELTDTFGGEANYSWCRRATIEAPDNASTRMLLSRARAALNICAVRGRVEDNNDTVTFWPRDECTVLFIVPTVEVNVG